MKKSALLAVSALSLGVVGLATFTPVVNAATTATGTATVAATVNQELAIGGQPITEGQDNPTTAFGTAFGATFDLDANDEDLTSQNGKEITIKNNSGHDGALTVSSQNPDMALAAGGDTIPANASVGTGASAWAIKSDHAGSQATSWTAVSSSPLTLGTDAGNGSAVYTVDYAASTDATQVAGAYSATITYTYTIQNLS